MKLLYKVTFHTYLTASLFPLAATGREDVLVVGNLTQERDTWNGKCEAMEKNLSAF